MSDLNERNAILTILSIECGDIAPRRLVYELAALGLPAYSVADGAALARQAGCHLTPFGTFAIVATQRVCTEAQRYARGMVLEALTFEYRAACPEWSARRAALIAGWVREDAARAAPPVRLRRSRRSPLLAEVA